MTGFEIKVDAEFIRIRLDKVWRFPRHTSYFGGYDADGQVDIKCGPYQVRVPSALLQGKSGIFIPTC
jgi:hypothetical protein